MTQPSDSPDLGAGTDISVDPADLDNTDTTDTPATSDPDAFTEDQELGGVGGSSPGGAG